MKSVCVYCGSSAGNDPAYQSAAIQMAEALADRGLALVYGGASIGVMGQVADAVLSRGGEVYGVIPGHLADYEIAHQGLTELILVDDMHQRKAEMSMRSDAFVALPGGFGTLEELFEALTWSQLALHNKPCGVLNTNNFYEHMLKFIDRQVGSGFVRPEHRDLLLVDDSAENLLDRLAACDEEHVSKLTGAVVKR